jgi:transposase
VLVTYTPADGGELLRGHATLLVWYPELPLRVTLADARLNAINGEWSMMCATRLLTVCTDWRLTSRVRLQSEETRRKRRAAEQFSCRTRRYQETSVNVFAKFTSGSAENYLGMCWMPGG